MNASAKKKSGDSDWDNRVLCSDGNCIGVIGHDRRCKECGKPYEGQLPFSIDEPPSDDQAADQAPENDTPEGRHENGSSEPDEMLSDDDEDNEDPDWDNRVLCSDGNCIGVIGPDGRCKECGKPYEDEPE